MIFLNIFAIDPFSLENNFFTIESNIVVRFCINSFAQYRSHFNITQMFTRFIIFNIDPLKIIQKSIKTISLFIA